MLLDPRLDANERFRERRRRAQRRRRFRRFALVAALVLVAAGLALGTRPLTSSEPAAEFPAVPPSAPPAPERAPTGLEPRAAPSELRGVHVAMPLASRFEAYVRMRKLGLNTIEIDVKDENGEVAFTAPAVPLARRIGASRPYYDPAFVARRAEQSGLYLIGRVVVFEDPLLAERLPGLAIHSRAGGVWRSGTGLGWGNPYDERVWKYNVDVAEAAVRAGFDEIMFDYVRFPTDGNLAQAAFPGRVRESRTRTMARFLTYATRRLHPLGAQVSVAVFGLAASRDLGVGQKPGALASLVDALYPMVFPSHYPRGALGLAAPEAHPAQAVARSLAAFRQALRGRPVRLVPWLQDFSLVRSYSAADVRAEIRAARSFGAQGFLLWNPSGRYTARALGSR